MLRPSSWYNEFLVGNLAFISDKFLTYIGSADAVLRDYQDNVIDRRRLPLLFNISGKAKQSFEPKRAQKRAVRGVAGRQHGNYCTLHLNGLLISDIHTYLVAPHIIPAVPPIDPLAQDPQHIDNGTAQELITSLVWTPAGDNLQTSNSVLSFFAPSLTLSTSGSSDQQPSWAGATNGILPAPDLSRWFTDPTPIDAPPLITSPSQYAVQLSELGFSSRDMGMVFL